MRLATGRPQIALRSIRATAPKSWVPAFAGTTVASATFFSPAASAPGDRPAGGWRRAQDPPLPSARGRW